MKRIVLLRHGESTWNKDNRFTGWTDVDLTEKGIADANQAGILLKEKGFHFDKAYTSFLKRAVKTLNCVLDKMDQDWIPVEKSWRLNEKHYGALQGLNKSETASKYGEEQVLIWRRSFNVAPNALPEDDPRNPKTDTRYKEVPDKDLPRTESLKETVERILPYWKCIIFPNLATANELLVVAHGNSLRGIIKYLKHIPDEEIVGLNLPTAVPYVFEFDNDLNLKKDYFLGDPEKIKKLMEAVADQGKTNHTKQEINGVNQHISNFQPTCISVSTTIGQNNRRVRTHTVRNDQYYHKQDQADQRLYCTFRIISQGSAKLCYRTNYSYCHTYSKHCIH